MSNLEFPVSEEPIREQLNFTEQPELVNLFQNMLGEIEEVIDVLQQEKIDFEFLIRVNDGLLKDFRLAISKYPEAQLYYEQHWDELNALESIPEVLLESDPDYIVNNRETLIEQFKQIHQCMQVPIIEGIQFDSEPPEDSDQKTTNINYVPQGISNDLAQGDDQLNLEAEIQAIADVLLLRQLQPPVAVGILGTWGSGKSFGMHLIQKRVNEIRCAPLEKYQAWGEGLEEDDLDKEKKLSPYVGHIYQIKFNAWSYAKANLWASLMEEIFSELNQQITFERQLQEAGVDLLTGGKIWEALEKLNEGDRQWFLRQHLDTEILNRLRKIELTSELDNELMTTLRRSQSQVFTDIQEQEKLLTQTKDTLKKRQCDITEGMQNNLQTILEASPELLHQLHTHFGQDIDVKITERIRLENPDFDPQNIKDLINTIGQTLKIFLGENKPSILSFPSLFRWSKKVHKPLLILVISLIFCIVVPWKIAPWMMSLVMKQSEIHLWQQGLSLLIPATPTVLKLKELLEKFNQWSQEAKLALHESQKRIEQQMQIEIEQDEQVKELNQRLVTLQKQIEQKRQQLPELQYDSLSEFLGDRLKPENYSNHLGMLNQVQQDLQNLSDKLLPSKKNQNEKIKELFPRGEPRVILYIDDLDRCPPQRVVEVLETVQLLLNTSLFVVVLAVDDRYIARALEEVYSGVLKRKGKPSGIDYLEKIIQIPYRMRPISADTVSQYLSSQIQVLQQPLKTNIKTDIDDSSQQQDLQSQQPIFQQQILEQQPIFQQQAMQTQQQQIIQPQLEEIPVIEPLNYLNEINTIDQQELDLIVECCKYVDITPRTGKRLINIYKILKIVWEKRQPQGEPSVEIKRIIFSFLALSGRYPDFMRNLFEEIDTRLQEEMELDSHEFYLENLLDILYQQVQESDYHAQREWRKFVSDIQRMILSHPFTLDKQSFQLTLAFCFVGDIGYDPDDFLRRVIESK